ncbi:Pogo transposable element-like 11, partial [Homarus americanus]
MVKMAPPAKRMKYNASFKLKVVRFAKESNNSAAAREFGVNEKQVRERKKAEEKLIDIPRTKCALRRGKQQWPELEEKLFENTICIYAIKLAKLNPDTCKDFKATRGWCSRFMNRKGLQSNGGSTTGHEKARFTVVLSCMADATKLKPMIIFKRKTMPKVKFPAGVYVHVHENGWMDEEGVRLWLEHIWSRRAGGLRKECSLLVWDMFRSHLTEPVKRCLKKHNTDTAVIPVELTSVVQPLDVCLNKPFKDRVTDRWYKWMIEGEKTFTKGGNMQAAPLSCCEN